MGGWNLTLDIVDIWILLTVCSVLPNIIISQLIYTTAEARVIMKYDLLSSYNNYNKTNLSVCVLHGPCPNAA